MINLGSAEIADLRVGASQVARVYLGEDIIWQPNFDPRRDLFLGRRQ